MTTTDPRLSTSVPRIDNAKHYMRRLTGPWPELLAAQPDDPLTRTMQGFLTSWRQSRDADLLVQATEPVLSRGDSNLLNWLRTVTGTACVDFEFSGYSTIAFEAADLTEHISSRIIPDDTWIALLPELGVDHTNLHLFHAAQRTCALRWLAVLWKQRDHRSEEFTVQHHRVALLFGMDNPYGQS